MVGATKKIGLIVIILGFLGFLVGIIFLFEGFSQQNYIITTMKSENISMAAFGGTPNEIVASMAEAQKAADTIREHRHSIAPSYGALLNGGQFDPTNPKDLTYAQAINLENYLYLGVTALGLTEVVLGAGGFMILASLAIIAAGYGLFVLTKK
jgi:hypothetical protein